MNEQKIRRANQEGLADRDGYRSYYTPTLQVAYNLGQAGVDLSAAPVVTGYRYGAAPESMISQNYASGTSERGLSLAALAGGKESGSAVWFAGRKIHTYTGILSGRGSDGEPLILSLDAEDWD